MASAEARKRYYEVLTAHQMGDPDLVSCTCNIHVRWNLTHQIDMLEEAGLIAPDLTRSVELAQHVKALVNGRQIMVDYADVNQEWVDVMDAEIFDVSLDDNDELIISAREVLDDPGADHRPNSAR